MGPPMIALLSILSSTFCTMTLFSSWTFCMLLVTKFKAGKKPKLSKSVAERILDGQDEYMEAFRTKEGRKSYVTSVKNQILQMEKIGGRWGGRWGSLVLDWIGKRAFGRRNEAIGFGVCGMRSKNSANFSML